MIWVGSGGIDLQGQWKINTHPKNVDQNLVKK